MRARSCRRRETPCSLSHIGHLELSQALRISQRECWTSLVARNSMCNRTHYCMPGQRSRGTRKVWSCASEQGGSIKKVALITTCFDTNSRTGRSSGRAVSECAPVHMMAACRRRYARFGVTTHNMAYLNQCQQPRAEEECLVAAEAHWHSKYHKV